MTKYYITTHSLSVSTYGRPIHTTLNSYVVATFLWTVGTRLRRKDTRKRTRKCTRTVVPVGVDVHVVVHVVVHALRARYVYAYMYTYMYMTTRRLYVYILCVPV